MSAGTSSSAQEAPSSPACVSADDAFQQLGIDRTTGYRAIKAGTFPLPVIRVGRLIRVPTAALRRALALDSGDDCEDPSLWARLLEGSSSVVLGAA